jgi:hypothetical protein
MAKVKSMSPKAVKGRIKRAQVKVAKAVSKRR